VLRACPLSLAPSVKIGQLSRYEGTETQEQDA
jgi:hypothetical protein